MHKTITQQIEDLQKENERLKSFEKLFEKALNNEFGINSKSIRKLIQNQSDFEDKICNYFRLKTDADKDSFISIMCNDSSLRFFNSKKEHFSAHK